MIPSQIAITPTSGSAIFITASLAVSNAPVVIAGSFPVKPPTSTATRRKASQIQFSMGSHYAAPAPHGAKEKRPRRIRLAATSPRRSMLDYDDFSNCS